MYIYIKACAPSLSVTVLVATAQQAIHACFKGALSVFAYKAIGCVVRLRFMVYFFFLLWLFYCLYSFVMVPRPS